MGQNNWRTPQTFEDLLVEIQKRLGAQERRASPVSAAELLGPGAAARAIQIGDWNESVASFNGNFYTEPGALHTPDPSFRWTGRVTARIDNSGIQEVWNTDDLDAVRYYMRTYTDDGTGQGRYYASWRKFATPSGYIEFNDIDPDYTQEIQNAINQAEEALGLVVPPLVVIRQATAPVPSAYPDRGLLVGDQWLDTDNGSKPYLWDGTSWVPYADYVLGTIPGSIDSLTEQVESAATLAEQAQQAAATASSDAADALQQAAQAVIDANEYTDNSLEVITGKVIQTRSEADRGVKITASGLVAYAGPSAAGPGPAPNGTPTLIIDGTTGSVTMLGALTSGSSVTGAVVTGGTVQTQSDAARGIKMTSAGLVAYDSVAGSSTLGQAKFTVDSATGRVIAVGGLLTGGTVTGAVLQTHPDANVGVKMTSAGLVGYGAGGDPSPTFLLDAATGSVTLVGTINAGSTINGSTITGSVLQTNGLANRGVKINDQGFVAYDSVATSPTLGQPTVLIDSATGAVSITGKIISTGLTVLGNMSIRGVSNYIEGTVTATAQIQNPTAGVTAANSAYATYYTSPTLAGSYAFWRAAPHPREANKVVLVGYNSSTNRIMLNVLNTTTGVVDTSFNSKAWQANASGDVSIASGRGTNAALNSNGFIYLAFARPGSSAIRLLKIDPVTYDLSLETSTPSVNPVSLGFDYTYNLVLGAANIANSPDAIFMRWNAGTLTNTEGNQNSVVFLPNLFQNNQEVVRDIEGGSFGAINPNLNEDYSYRFTISYATQGMTKSTPRFRFYTTFTANMQPISGYDFNTGSAYPWQLGTWWNGTTFVAYGYTLNPSGSDGFFTFGRYGRNPLPVYYQAGYTWYDGDSGGTGLHESRVGGAVPLGRGIRQVVTITTPPAPQSGTVDSNLDKANQTGLYVAVGTSSNYTTLDLNTVGKRQTQQKSAGYSGLLNGGVTDTTWVIEENFTTTGATPPTQNGFDSVAKVGNLRSQTLTSTSGWNFSGDRTAQVGRYTWGANGNRTDVRVVGRNWVANSNGGTGQFFGNASSYTSPSQGFTIPAGTLIRIKGHFSVKWFGNQDTGISLQLSSDNANWITVDNAYGHTQGYADPLEFFLEGFVEANNNTAIYVRFQASSGGGGTNGTIRTLNVTMNALS